MVKKKNKATPKDRTPCEVYSRIVGYLRPVSQWNEGKASEYQMRKEYSGK
ncbi:MAG: anaerobic ribonucleoside-triphosphate reductase [Candidatus Shapirobacteria bacterium]|nr:anaerobic ribonucleoside-triphosphate reductase [Candidatus Shapirobacteria bacterium]MDD5073648.1 anaerobic ribonucleoside-triphosphate reductase [Candidatus Shapirobacteria bacterium]MDD5481391.1 anaerobic ribonucleoside-triphosphate reductase [Candidatus Shapirobacteria bacterium]